MSEHNPLRPAWECGACAERWPCATRGQQLTAEHVNAPTALTMYLAASMVDAASDLGSWPAGALFDRFLGWQWQKKSTVPVPIPLHAGVRGDQRSWLSTAHGARTD